MTARARLRQADYQRMLRAAAKEGHVIAGMRPDGTIIFQLPGAPPLVPAAEPVNDAPAAPASPFAGRA